MGKAAGEKLDLELAASALRKRRDGSRPTRDESAALRRVERARDDESRAAAYRAIPKKDWRSWAGCQHKTLDDFADRFGIPTTEPGDKQRAGTIELPPVIRWLYRFLKEHGPAIAAAQKNTEPDSRSEVNRWEAKLRELKYRQEAAGLVELAEMERGFVMVSEILRRAGEAIRVEYGDDAAKILTNAWADVVAKVEIMFAVEE